MSIKKTIPIAFVANKVNAQATSSNTNLQTTNVNSQPQTSQVNPKIDNTVEFQISNLIDSIIAPKITKNPFKCLLIPANAFQPENLDLLSKQMLVPKRTKDLFLGYAKDAEVLIISAFVPNEINVFDSIANNESTLANHITLSMDFNQFRGKLDLVLESLRIAANVTVDNSYQERMEEVIKAASTDIMFNWKRMEDLKKYGNRLVNQVRDGILGDLDRRTSTGDVQIEEVSVIIQTMEYAFEELKRELATRYNQIETFDNLSVNQKLEQVGKNAKLKVLDTFTEKQKTSTQSYTYPNFNIGR